MYSWSKTTSKSFVTKGDLMQQPLSIKKDPSLNQIFIEVSFLAWINWINRKQDRMDFLILQELSLGPVHWFKFLLPTLICHWHAISLIGGIYFCPTMVESLLEIMVLFWPKTKEDPSQKYETTKPQISNWFIMVKMMHLPYLTSCWSDQFRPENFTRSLFFGTNWFKAHGASYGHLFIHTQILWAFYWDIL